MLGAFRLGSHHPARIPHPHDLSGALSGPHPLSAPAEWNRLIDLGKQEVRRLSDGLPPHAPALRGVQ
ncbi:hypothetical protein LT493_31795 [Streptomyces tricolor]|nr:hypothetical protein [Streptomyces tricolor]